MKRQAYGSSNTRRTPRHDFDWLNDRMDGCEGWIKLHWTRADGFREDKVEVNLFERAPRPDNTA